MFPYIHTSFGDLSVFTVFVAVGVTAMILNIDFLLKKANNRYKEEAFIFHKIIICGLLGFIFATVTDFIFKYIKYGTLKIYGMAFYGGLIGASISMYVLLKISKKQTQYSISEWFDLLICPFIVFHFFGRLGCFFAGCCYGRYSDSVFAIAFPDNEIMGIIHNGRKCFPTQLFEALALMIIFIVVTYSKKKYKTYIIFYALVRFALEFLRGDDRGYILNWISPAQIISVAIILTVILYEIICKKRIKNPSQ